MVNDPDILSPVRRSDRALCEQVSQWESLEFGVAHVNPALPSVADANQLREVWLAEVDGVAAFARTEAYYAERGITCLAWTPASGQAVEPVESLLIAKGWRRVNSTAMLLHDWGILDQPTDSTIRVLPARAMRKAFHGTFTGSSADAAIERLNDPNYDCFVAMIEGSAAGRIGYLQAGDVARLHDLFVLPSRRARGVASALVHQCLQLARRLLPKSIVASVEPDGPEEISFLKKCGFAAAGVTTRFQRPASAC